MKSSSYGLLLSPFYPIIYLLARKERFGEQERGITIAFSLSPTAAIQ